MEGNWDTGDEEEETVEACEAEADGAEEPAGGSDPWGAPGRVFFVTSLVRVRFLISLVRLAYLRGVGAASWVLAHTAGRQVTGFG